MGFTSIPIRNIMREAVARGGIIVDVRSNEDFLEGHIPMAVNVPMEQLKSGTYSLPKSRYLLVYCRYGGGSAMASRILSQDGYKVINTIGGLAQYRGPMTRQR